MLAEKLELDVDANWKASIGSARCETTVAAICPDLLSEIQRKSTSSGLREEESRVARQQDLHFSGSFSGCASAT